MKSIALYNNKGGVGKTTIAINIASELAEKNKVLVIDFDGQANCSRYFAEPKAGLETALIKSSFSPAAARSTTRYPNIDILTATAGLNLITAQFEQLSDEVRTANVHKILEFDGGYDYALIDLPPALTKITEKVITLCDSVFVPIELGTFAIRGIPTVTGVLANCKAKFGGCIVNKFDKENPADTELSELLRTMLGNKVLKTFVPFSRVIKNSFSYKLTAKEYMKWTAAAQTFENLSAEIIERTNEEL
jgi:chromosome partitioning protein